MEIKSIIIASTLLGTFTMTNKPPQSPVPTLPYEQNRITINVPSEYYNITTKDGDIVINLKPVPRPTQQTPKPKPTQKPKPTPKPQPNQTPKPKPTPKPTPRPTPKQTTQPKPIVRQESSEWKPFVFTHYTASCKGCSGVTATGINVKNRTHYNGMRIIATNPNVIPFYSIVELKYPNGMIEKAIALDTGGAMRNHSNLIDVLVATREEAIQKGRVNGQLRILKRGR
jgi:3D (Asp-Asp-Asp) domain-containing protein